jgi:hypothetical protein
MRTGTVLAEAGQFVPRFGAVGGTEECGVFDSGIDCIHIRERGFEMPNALELPWVGSAVVPLMGAGDTIVDEFVFDGLPGSTAVVGALDELTEPAAGLGGVKTVGVDGGAFDVIDLPTAKVRAGDVPLTAFSVGSEDERTFPGADEDPDVAHKLLFLLYKTLCLATTLEAMILQTHVGHWRGGRVLVRRVSANFKRVLSP